MKSFIRRRRKFLINNDLQFSLLFASLFYVFSFIAVIGSALFIPLFMELDIAHGSSLKVQQAATVLLYLHANFWPAVLFSLVLIVILSIRASHRVAGPLYRITLVLDALKEGNLPKAVHLRKGDRLAAEIEITNQMLERLRIKVGGIQKAEAELNDAIAACSKVIGHAPDEEITERLNDIKEKGNQLAERIGYFKIE